MLRLLIDASTLLDLAKRRDGQKWIVPLRVFAHQAKLELLVPTVVIDEFKRNRARVETSMTASVSERFRLIKRDLDEYGGETSSADTVITIIGNLTGDPELRFTRRAQP